MSDQDNPKGSSEPPEQANGIDSEAVGYCRPPVHSRWKKGQSGNPRGRTKGGPNLSTVLERELSQRVTIREGDGSRKISRLAAVVIATATKAIKGDQRAAGLILAYAAKLNSDPEVADTSLSADDEAILAAFIARHKQQGGNDG